MPVLHAEPDLLQLCAVDRPAQALGAVLRRSVGTSCQAVPRVCVTNRAQRSSRSTDSLSGRGNVVNFKAQDAQNRRQRRGAIRVLAAVSAVIVSLALASCSSSGTGSAGPGNTSSATGQNGGGDTGSNGIPTLSKDPAIAKLVPEQIRKKGSLSVASENYPTAVIVPPGGGAPTGYEPAFAHALGQLMGLGINIHIVPFDSIIPGLAAKRYDIAMGLIAINPDRNKVVTFVSEMSSTDAFMVKAGSSLNLKTPTDACGLTIAALAGSVEAAEVQKANQECKAKGKPITIQLYNDQSGANLAVQSGRAQADVGSASTLNYVIQQNKGQFQLQGSFTSTGKADLCGIAIPKTSYGLQLAKALQAGMNELRKKGMYKAILDKWNNGQGLIPRSKIYPVTS